MMHPIDPEKYIAAMRLEFGPNEAAEEAHRVIIPFMNDAYRDGKAGVSGYPMDPAAEIARFEAKRGPLDKWGKQFIPVLVRCANAAYAQGQEARQ